MTGKPLLALILTLGLGLPAVAQDRHGHDRHAHDRSRYGNPADLDAYIDNLMDPERERWQQPERVVRSLGLQAGDTACDVGAGPGYFSLRLARAVGDSGRVYAVDVVPRILATLRDRLGEAGITNVTPVLALGDNALLPDAACDIILIVNAYHHFPDGPGYLRRLSGALAPGGRVVNIDYRMDATRGPDHKVARRAFLEQARQGGLRMAGEETFLEHQYFIVLQPRS